MCQLLIRIIYVRFGLNQVEASLSRKLEFLIFRTVCAIICFFSRLYKHEKSIFHTYSKHRFL